MNTHLKEVLSKSAIAGIFLGAAAILQFVFNVLVSRQLGADEAGLFFLSLSVILFLGILSRLGLDMSIVRFGSPMSASGNRTGLRKLARQGLTIGLVVGIPLTVAVYLIAPILSENVFNDARVEPVLRIMIFSLVPIIVGSIFSELLRAQKKVAQALIIKYIAWLIPVITLVYLYANTVDSVSRFFVLSIIFSALLGWLMFWRSTARIKLAEKAPQLPTKTLLYTSLPLLIVVLSGRTMEWMDSVMLGALADSEAVSLYNAAIQISFAVSFVLLAINTINSSKFAELYSSKKMADLKNLFLKSARVATLVATPIMLILLLFGPQLLSIFGDGFVSAQTALSILVIGQFINVTVGSVAYLLAMTDQGGALAKVTVLVNVLNIVLNLVLIPKFGINGAAFATAFSLGLRNVVLLFLVKKKLNRRISVAT